MLGTKRDYDGLLEMAQGARFVLLGEATHGVHVDRTCAVEPLEIGQAWTAEPPDTYPSAL